MKLMILSAILVLGTVASIVFGQEQSFWQPSDSTVVFMDSGSGFTFCHPKNWTIHRRQKTENDETRLWLEMFDFDYTNPPNKGMDIVEHKYYVTLIPHMTTTAELWSKQDSTASDIRKIKIKSRSIIECVLTDTSSGVYNGTMSRAVRFVENKYGVEITSFSFSQVNSPFLYTIANSIKFTKTNRRTGTK
jgi:hypothetical protein